MRFLGLGLGLELDNWRFSLLAMALFLYFLNESMMLVAVMLRRLEVGEVRRFVMRGFMSLLTPLRRTQLTRREVLMNPGCWGSSNSEVTLVVFRLTSSPNSSIVWSPWVQWRKEYIVLSDITALSCVCVTVMI